MKRNNHISKGVLILFLVAKIGFAQEENSTANEPLVTDRPDATEASSTVGKGVLQIETGALDDSFEENNIILSLKGSSVRRLQNGS